MSNEIQSNLTNQYMFDGHFGIEKESLRVLENGHLSHTPHPFMDVPNIDRDFCENQIEIITDVCDSVDEVYAQLADFHNIAVKRLYTLASGKEYVWNFSNPPYVKGEQDIPIAHFEGRKKNKEVYREYLASKYGKMKMLFSGIHFNFSFSETYLKTVFATSGGKDYQAFKNDLYLNLAKNAARYSWLVVYLTAASPLMDGSYINDGKPGEDVYSAFASGRCSRVGYWNNFIPILNYENLNTYIDSIQEYVDAGQLKSSAELYYPVRIKPRGDNTLESLRENGVNHIELRCIDLNPLSDIGLRKEDVSFMHYLMIYLNALEQEAFEDFEQVMAIKNTQKAALFDEDEIEIETEWSDSGNVREVALQVLECMEAFFEQQKTDAGLKELAGQAVANMHYQKNKILQPQERYATKVRNLFGDGYVKQGLKHAENYAGALSNSGTT